MKEARGRWGCSQRVKSVPGPVFLRISFSVGISTDRSPERRELVIADLHPLGAQARRRPEETESRRANGE